MKYQKSKIKFRFAAAAVLFNLSFLIFHQAVAQQPLPDTEIYLINISQTDSGLVLDDGRLLTNHKGYDDHPSFSYDGFYLYYTSERDDYKTDIYTIFLPQFQNVEFISTGSVSELLPQQKPDMKGISVLRHDETMNTKQLWFYGTDAMDKNLAPDLKNISYYTWLNDSLVALRIDDKNSNELRIRNLNTNKDIAVTKNIGTSIAKIPSENGIYFTQTVAGLERLVRHYYDSGKTDTLLYLPAGAKDFCVAMDGSLWAANEGVIYRWPRAAAKWDMVKHLGQGALGAAYRVAISRDLKQLAVVTDMSKF